MNNAFFHDLWFIIVHYGPITSYIFIDIDNNKRRRMHTQGKPALKPLETLPGTMAFNPNIK